MNGHRLSEAASPQSGLAGAVVKIEGRGSHLKGHLSYLGLLRRICGYDSVKSSSMSVIISLPGESTSVFSGVRNEISMSVIQSQCAVACSTMPLQIKFFTTAALERGRLGRQTGLVTGTIIQCHHPMTTFCFPNKFYGNHYLPDLARRALYYALGC